MNKIFIILEKRSVFVISAKRKQRIFKMQTKVLLRNSELNLRSSIMPKVLVSVEGYYQEGAYLPAYEVRRLEPYYISLEGGEGDTKIYVTLVNVKHNSKKCDCIHKIGRGPVILSEGGHGWGMTESYEVFDVNPETIALEGTSSTVGLYFSHLHKCRCPMMIKICGTVARNYINETLLVVNADGVEELEDKRDNDVFQVSFLV